MISLSKHLTSFKVGWRVVLDDGSLPGHAEPQAY
jgi:hypothetical protein